MKPIFKNLILLALILQTPHVQAQLTNRDTIKEQKIEVQLKSLDSSVVETFRQATIALDQNNFKLADSLYTMVYKKVPDFDPVLRRLGSIRAELGNPYNGINLCEKAVTINRSAYNLLTLAGCYYHYEGYRDPDKALQLLQEARHLPDGDDISIIALIGQIELEKENLPAFRNITQTLQEKYPDEILTHYYSAIVAASESKWTEAKKEILIAQELGLPEETVQGFLDTGVGSRAARRSYAIGFIWIVVFWVAGLLLLFIVGKLLSNITLKSIEKDGFRESKNSLRSLYKMLINFGGVYYYISLPIVLILVIALVGALIYLSFMAGHIPVKLLFILVIGAAFTVYGMVRSLLLKVKYTDPGRELNREEAPKLFDLTREVAETIDTRPVDEIRITHGTDLAVYERGSWKEKLQDKAQRILIIGTGVLKDFKKDDFKAVLAHEYGHFSHRDTAGGEIALRVVNDMNKYFYALYEGGQTVWWNLAFQFLRVYNFIFRRISHGSTRLQEILADRVAAKTYGIKSFENGLTYVIRRDIEFNYLASKEIEEVNKVSRPLKNFYELQEPTDNFVEVELEKALKSPTSEDDTHPSPADRFRYISRIDTAYVGNDSKLVKELFKDWDSITKEMTELIEKAVKNPGE